MKQPIPSMLARALRRPARRPLGQRFLTTVSIIVTLAVLPLVASAAPFGRATSPHLTAQTLSAKLELSPATVKIGDTVSVTGSGYPTDTDVDLVYHTVKGRYAIKDRSEFVGQRYDETTQVLATVHSDKNGRISGQFRTPVGYGGPHDVRGRVAGQDRSQAGIMVQPTVTMEPAAGPIGTLIELRIAGVDLRTSVNTWQILYDNHYLGFASAVTTDGVAVARFRAAGPVGSHIIQAWNNAYNSTPYLAWDTSPFKDDFTVPATFTFQATSDPGYIPPQVDDFSETDAPWPLDQVYPAKLALSVDRGVVGQPTTLTGTGLPANTEIALSYTTMVGNRVSGIGFEEQSAPLGSVTTGSDGTFVHEMAIPDDLGGTHRIEASVSNNVVAATGFVVIPSVVSISPIKVRAGEQVEIHLKGLGWTTYDNTYTVTYDNAHIGYVCGFSTNGDVDFKLMVTGGPGTHLIDLYPTIYKGQEPTPKTFSVPQLTYAQDHPGRTLPAIRLTIEVVS
jgi:hypothetical protein